MYHEVARLSAGSWVLEVESKAEWNKQMAKKAEPPMGLP